MNVFDPKVRRVLAIDPTSSGFGFAVLEGPESLVDWGGRSAINAQSAVGKVIGMLRQYRVDVLVVEDCGDARSRRGQRVRHLIQSMIVAARATSVECARVRITGVRRLFGGDVPTNKDTIARVIADHFGELAPRLPPKRKVWMTEPTRMAIFDAVAFGLTYYYESSGAASPSAIKDYDGRLHDAGAARDHRGDDRDGYEKDK